MTEPAHSELGPSAADRWMSCPGSVLATRGLPDEDTPYSLVGNAEHDLVETCNALDKPARDFIGQIIRVKKVDGTWYEHKVDEEVASTAQEFLDRVNELPGIDLNESRVCYTRWIPGGFGTLDRARIAPSIANIRDFKSGTGVKVDAKENPQNRLYAVGLIHDYDWLYPLDKFSLGIIQPRLDHYDEEEITRSDLMSWFHDEAVPAAQLALAPGAPFKAGEWCRFCKLRATCVIRAASVFKVIPRHVEFSNLDEAIADQTPPQVVGALTPAQIADILGQKKNIQNFLKDISAYAMREIQQKRPIGDYKLVAGRGSREFNAAEDEVAAAVVEQTGIDSKELWTQPELLSVAKIEDKVGKKRFKLIEQKYVTKHPGKPTLAPGDDKRPALESGGVEFSNLDAEDEE